MKIIRFGNQHSRYALIFERRDNNNRIHNVDDTIVFYCSDNLELLRNKYADLKKHEPEHLWYSLDIFDYKEMCYRKVMR